MIDEFIHNYEMESLSLGITARKDVIDQVSAFFPRDAQARGIAGMFRTSEVLAARWREEKEANGDENEDESEANDWHLVIAGNSKECFRNRFRNIHMVALANAILKTKLSGIRELNLCYNHLGEEHEGADDEHDKEDEHGLHERKYLLDAAPYLERLLQTTAMYTSTIEELNLSGNRLGGESCRLLCASLANNTTLRRLNLNGNPLRVAGGHAIAALLASWESRLEELSIGNTEMETENLIAIASALRSNDTLTSLNLDNPVVKTKEV
jgi:Ran GTPase-activating protein (RanGAP) involved in mRNA processing and transport